MKEGLVTEIFKLIKENTSFEENEVVKFTIEYYTKEIGNSIDRFYTKNDGIVVNDRSLDAAFIWNFGSKLDEFFQESSIGENCWNKAEFILFKDGRYEVNTWWDTDFQKSLYGTEN